VFDSTLSPTHVSGHAREQYLVLRSAPQPEGEPEAQPELSARPCETSRHTLRYLLPTAASTYNETTTNPVL